MLHCNEELGFYGHSDAMQQPTPPAFFLLMSGLRKKILLNILNSWGFGFD